MQLLADHRLEFTAEPLPLRSTFGGPCAANAPRTVLREMPNVLTIIFLSALTTPVFLLPRTWRQALEGRQFRPSIGSAFSVVVDRHLLCTTQGQMFTAVKVTTGGPARLCPKSYISSPRPKGLAGSRNAASLRPECSGVELRKIRRRYPLPKAAWRTTPTFDCMQTFALARPAGFVVVPSERQ